MCVCGRARVPTRHPLGRAAAVRVTVPLRRRAPVRGPPGRTRGGNKKGLSLRGRGLKRILTEEMSEARGPHWLLIRRGDSSENALRGENSRSRFSEGV